MKAILLAVFFCITAIGTTVAQGKGRGGEEGITPKMIEHIAKQTNMTDTEQDKFKPVFVQYLKEFNKTHEANKEDKLVLQQKIAELRISYRKKFRDIMSDEKADKVFPAEDNFRKTVLKALQEKQKRN